VILIVHSREKLKKIKMRGPGTAEIRVFSFDFYEFNSTAPGLSFFDIFLNFSGLQTKDHIAPTL